MTTAEQDTIKANELCIQLRELNRVLHINDLEFLFNAKIGRIEITQKRETGPRQVFLTVNEAKVLNTLLNVLLTEVPDYSAEEKYDA
jgi:hypothetical protein